MATFSRTSFLCSDFHVRNLLGISKDEKSQDILITCKGVVNQFNVRDRKLIRSWTTRSWHPFTSAAVCDPETNQIAVVISNSSISMWSHDEDSIDKVKRHTFPSPIDRLLVCGQYTYVVFSNGYVEKLKSALASRKDAKSGFLSEGENICYVQLIQNPKVAILITRKEECSPKLYKLNLDLEQSTLTASSDLSLPDAQLTGICVMSSLRLLTLWSNREFYSFDLQSDLLKNLPGSQTSKEMTIDARRNSKILELSPDHIVIVGMERKDGGGLLVLRDIKFAVVTSSRKMKMYHDPPLAWAVEEGLIIAEGGSLALIPYTVTESSLATMFGTKVGAKEPSIEDQCDGWKQEEGMETDNIFEDKLDEFNEMVNSLKKPGLAESLIVKNLVNHLIEKKHLLFLKKAMDIFKDVPESSLVDILIFYLSCDDAAFEGLCECPLMQMACEPVGEDAEEIRCPYGASKAYFLNSVLRQPFTDVQLLHDLPRIPFSHVLTLIQYLHFLITSGESELIPTENTQVPSLSEASEWLSLLLDTNYHQLVMSSQVTIHRLLLSCFTQVTNTRKVLESLMDMQPLVNRIIQAKDLPQQKNSTSAYSVERLVIT